MNQPDTTPNDLATPITREWLDIVSRQLRRQTFYTLRLWREGIVVLTDHVSGLPDAQAIALPTIKTRGNVLQLVELLGMKTGNARP